MVEAPAGASALRNCQSVHLPVGLIIASAVRRRQPDKLPSPKKRAPELYFDLTTTLCWGGTPVGITRVEREIARRAPGRAHMPVKYCFFQRSTDAFYELSQTAAAAVLDGKFSIDPVDLMAARLDGHGKYDALARELLPHDGSKLQDAKALALAGPHLRKMSVGEINEIRRGHSLIHINENGQRRLVSVADIAVRPVKLSAATWIINAGLDWEHKDLRSMRILKKKKKFKYIAVIYDLIPLLFPQYVVPFYVNLLKRYFGELFWTADAAICISETTRKDALAYLSAFQMPAISMASWPLGSDMHAAKPTEVVISKRLEQKKYLLYVSTIEPRKSHRTIVDAFESLIRKGQIDEDAYCVFVGRVGWNTDNLIQEIRVNPLLRDRIIIMSDVSDDELVSIYKGARFVVFPSRYEGYGLSLVEAMAQGKACISADTGSLVEVGGEAPLYIDPSDIKAWGDAIGRFMRDDDLVEEYERRSATHYRPVTWDESADVFYRLINDTMAAAR